MRRAALFLLVCMALLAKPAQAETWESWKDAHPFHLRPLVLHAEVTPSDAQFLIREWNHKLKRGLVRRWKAWVSSFPNEGPAIVYTPYTGDHQALWLCIHSLEGSWTDPDPPYWGGLQMGIGFMEAYGGSLYAEKGTADHWTPDEQVGVAESAWDINGFSMSWLFSQWPISGPACA